MQAQAAFSQHYAHMAGQHAQQLSAHAAQRTSSTAAAASTNHSSSNSVISLLADSLQAHVARLQGVLDQGCSAGTAADGSALVSPAVVGGAAAAQAGAAGGPQTSRGGAPDTADGVGGALMAQAATAAQSLRAADQASSWAGTLLCHVLVLYFFAFKDWAVVVHMCLAAIVLSSCACVSDASQPVLLNYT